MLLTVLKLILPSLVGSGGGILSRILDFKEKKTDRDFELKVLEEKIKQYLIDNKEKLKQYRKQYYINNKETINQYLIDNKDKINKKHNCECSGKYMYAYKSRHNKSLKHKKYIESLNASS